MRMRRLVSTALGLAGLAVIPAFAIGQQTDPPPASRGPGGGPRRHALPHPLRELSREQGHRRWSGRSALRTKPADLTSLARRADGKFPEERVRSTIDGRTEIDAHGAREMPVWGLSFAEPGRDAQREGEVEAEIRALVRYLASLQRLSASDGAP